MSFLDDLYSEVTEAPAALEETVRGAISDVTSGDAERVAGVVPGGSIVYDVGRSTRTGVIDPAVATVQQTRQSIASSIGNSIKQSYDSVRTSFNQAQSSAKWILLAVAIGILLWLAYLVFVAIGLFGVLNRALNTVGTGVGIGIGRGVTGG